MIPMMHDYITRLHAAIRKKRTAALVGIDPRWDQLPTEVIDTARQRHPENELRARAAAYEEFSFRLIDIVAPLVPAVKPQSAFFEELGPFGSAALCRVIRRARDSGLVVICDAKRGDIGSTAAAYANAYLAGDDPDAAPFAADALTVNPYLGRDTLEPFVNTAQQRGGGIYVLVRTSNPGAGDFQDLVHQASPVFQHVAAAVEEFGIKTACGRDYGNVGAVVGATYPRELAALRQQMPHVPFLVPGYGSQGGDAASVSAAFDGNGLGAVVNSSRGINFAYRQQPFVEQFTEDQWESAVEAATLQMIADLAHGTPCDQWGPPSQPTTDH
ncbi:MAG: orotidine-5'-phosphate decarboxylase [Planctomycetaceae bacterium]